MKKDPPTIQVIGKLESLMSTKVTVEKDMDPENPIVTIIINKYPIANTLINLGVAINVMMLETLNQLGLHNLLPTPTVFEFPDRSKVKIEGI
jgi:hypothetical protein